MEKVVDKLLWLYEQLEELNIQQINLKLGMAKQLLSETGQMILSIETDGTSKNLENFDRIKDGLHFSTDSVVAVIYKS